MCAWVHAPFALARTVSPGESIGVDVCYDVLKHAVFNPSRLSLASLEYPAEPPRQEVEDRVPSVRLFLLSRRLDRVIPTKGRMRDWDETTKGCDGARTYDSTMIANSALRRIKNATTMKLQ